MKTIHFPTDRDRKTYSAGMAEVERKRALARKLGQTTRTAQEIHEASVAEGKRIVAYKLGKANLTRNMDARKREFSAVATRNGTITFYKMGTDSVIDEAAGIIRGVSLIKMGDAQGHMDAEGRQEVVDRTTLQQVLASCSKARSIKVKADHGSGVLSTVGWMDNFSIKGEKVIGDLHIYTSEPQRPRIFEIARTNPDHMGMSLEFIGDSQPSGRKTLSRCEKVLAIALVSHAAANGSLF